MTSWRKLTGAKEASAVLESEVLRLKKNRTDNPYVICPYFKSECKETVFCEGVEENNSIHLAFATPDRRRNYQERFCKCNWKRCLVAEILNRKWGYEV